MVMPPLADNYRPMLQWVWDCDPTPELIRRQLELVRQVEFAGVVIQPMPDNFRPHDFPVRMTMPYLGEAFFEAIRCAVSTAAELGLIVWIYDEGGWPSGSASGAVLRGHEHLRARAMIRESGRSIVVPGDRPDPLKLEAIERFIALTHDAYARAVGDHFGSTIRAVFTDELTVHGCVGTDRVPWTDDLPDAFARRWGYDLAEVLPLLFEGAAATLAPEARVRQVRHDFSRLCVELFIERCLAPQRQWCERHGLQFVGHFAGEHDLMRHPHNVGDYMAAARRLHAPGVDAIWRQIWPDHRADFARFAGSLRLLTGADAFSETGAVYGIDLSPGQWKWVCDQQILRGINRFSLMSLRLSGVINQGLSPLDVESPTWPAMRQVNRHVHALAQACSTGAPVVSHAVLYPGDDLCACGRDGAGMAAQGIMEQLQAAGIEAVYVDETALADGSMIRLGVRELLLPGGAVVTAALVARLHAVERAGVQVRVVGHAALRVMGEEANSTWPATELNLSRGPGALVQWDTNGPISVTRRRGEGWQADILFNESPHEQRVRLTDPGAVVTDVDDELTLRPAPGPGAGAGPGASGEVTLAPGAVVAVSRGPWPLLPGEARQGDQRRWLDVPLRGWRMAVVHQLRIGAGDRWVCVPGKGDAAAEPGPWRGVLGDDFSGLVRYTAEFHLAQDIAGLEVDLGEVEHWARVWVDGRSLGERSWRPYRWRADLTLGPGAHRLEVEVGNTAAGAYWSAAAVSARQAAGRENIYTQRVRERCPVQLGGGLLGPARVRVARLERD
jgi:hypothetical protein